MANTTSKYWIYLVSAFLVVAFIFNRDNFENNSNTGSPQIPTSPANTSSPQSRNTDEPSITLDTNSLLSRNVEMDRRAMNSARDPIDRKYQCKLTLRVLGTGSSKALQIEEIGPQQVEVNWGVVRFSNFDVTGAIYLTNGFGTQIVPIPSGVSNRSIQVDVYSVPIFNPANLVCSASINQ